MRDRGALVASNQLVGYSLGQSVAVMRQSIGHLASKRVIVQEQQVANFQAATSLLRLRFRLRNSIVLFSREMLQDDDRPKET